MSSSSFASFEEWKWRFPMLLPHFTFTPLDNSLRDDIHLREVTGIRKFITFLTGTIDDIQHSISLLATENPLDINDTAYDDTSHFLILRKIAFIKRKIHSHRIRELTLRFGILSEFASSADSALTLFTSNLIPPDLVCRVSETFFEVSYGDAVLHNMKRLAYFVPFLARLHAELSTKPRPLWATDFPGFLRELVTDVLTRDLSSPPWEVSLSRCVFHSALRAEADALADRVAAGDAEPFLALPAFLAALPEIDHASRPAVAFLSFKCVFNRVYERRPDLFAPVFGPLQTKLQRLSQMEAKLFVLPKAAFPEDVGDVAVCELFRGNGCCRAAAAFLEDACFACNPIDALLILSRAVAQARTAAGDGVNTVVSFDDQFAMLFGSLMASGPPVADIFGLVALLRRFDPRQCLWPSLEFTKAMVEALALHITDFEPDRT
jgi:hypothetical protein